MGRVLPKTHAERIMSSVSSQSASLSTPEQLAAERLMGIDVLRGLAVLAVVLNHTPHYAHGGFRENPWFFPALAMDLGYLGVPLFVLISGFCIHRRAAIKKAKSGADQSTRLNWVEFWKKRFWRLYPPYLAAIVLSLSCAFWLHDRSNDLFQSLIPDLLTHLFLVHNLTAKYPVGLGNGAFWSLGMAEQLYLLYFPLFFLIRKRNAIFAALVAAVTTISWRFWISSSAMASVESIGGLGMWGMWPFSYWMHWSLGALAVDAYFGNSRLPAWCSSIRVALGTIIVGCLANGMVFSFLTKTGLAVHPVMQVWSRHLVQVGISGELMTAVGFFCLMNWCVQNSQTLILQNPVSRVFAWMGKISYSIYLTHVPLLFLLEEYLPLSHSVTDWALRMLIYPTVCLMVGFGFFVAVERWFLAGRNPLIRARSYVAELASPKQSSF